MQVQRFKDRSIEQKFAVSNKIRSRSKKLKKVEGNVLAIEMLFPWTPGLPHAFLKHSLEPYAGARNLSPLSCIK